MTDPPGPVELEGGELLDERPSAAAASTAAPKRTAEDYRRWADFVVRVYLEQLKSSPQQRDE